jgi:phosphatidylglycerophosphatase C
MKELALFDFDKTITTKDSFVLFLKYITPAAKWYRFISTIPYFLGYFTGMLSAGKSKALILKKIAGKTSKEELQVKAKAFIDFLHRENIIIPAMIDKILTHKKNGADIAIVSASADLWIKPFCEKYGVTCISTELNYTGNTLSGRLNTPNCKGFEKERRVKEIFETSSYTHIAAYGDGRGDKQMLALASLKKIE